MMPKIWAKFQRGHPQRGRQMGWSKKFLTLLGSIAPWSPRWICHCMAVTVRRARAAMSAGGVSSNVDF